MDDAKRGGFFPLPAQKTCNHPNHSFPTMLYIPPGQGYRHICPSCGREAVAYGQGVTLGELVC